MKGFIKITDNNQRVHYLNIDYILKFNPLEENYDSNTVIHLGGGERVLAINTSSTCEEIVDMIDIAIK